MATKAVKVRVVAGAVLLHEGQTLYAGHELEVSAAEAKVLVEQGSAEHVGKASK